MLSELLNYNAIYLYMQYQSQQKIHELSKRNKILCDKVGKLTEKCENAETEYAILKSLDLNSHEEL